MGKNKTGLYAGIAAIVVVIAVIIGVVLAKGGGSNNNGGDDNGTINNPDETLVDDVDYDTVDVSIAFGDYEAMSELSKEIQNGEATGKIVEIEGIVSHPMSLYSIVQESEDGTGSIGTQFIIEGAEDSDYPEDGDRITITGEVVEKEPLYFVIKTTPDYVYTD